MPKKNKMKAIILAAGMGTRLGKYGRDKPKCMLDFLGKSLVERQIGLFKKLGIEDIILIRGHLGEKIKIPNIKYINWSGPETNMIVDFFQARKEFNDDIIMSYGDILFEKNVLKKVMRCKAEIGVVADVEWKDYWVARLGNHKKDSESFVIGKDNKIISLGAENPSEEDMDARYVGLIKFSKGAWPKIKEIYDCAVKTSWEKPWHASKSFKKAHTTDFLQELIDKGLDVRAIKIQHGWMEFDTVEDYENSLKWGRQGDLERFYNLKL